MLRLPEPPDTPSFAALEGHFARLAPGQAPRWGRMTAAQMTRHCRLFAELCLGRVATPLPLRVVARLVGPWFLRRLLSRSPRRTPKNLRTLAPLRATTGENSDLDDERRRLATVFAELANAPDPMRHPLYGAMPRDSVQALVRHHTAHHLNQFGLLDDAT
jgi:hypothetical protein